MKKTTMRVTMVVIVLVAAVVAYYAYLSNQTKESRRDATLTAVQSVLSRNLENDYPKTVKEVIKYYNEIMKCYYNEECTEAEIEDLGIQARGLYDAELLEENEVTVYMQRLYDEITDFKDHKRKITSISLAGSTSVDYFEQDGYSFARIQCIYNVSEDGVTTGSIERYLLRQDENRRWKIYGWELVPQTN
ncbi:MAG: hypothetical protein NC417_05170 [Candidatus Gastranaerophilales bacterium]|nr:hypothetical protein [Candidatus Gastranaerophilales bacterium]